MSDQSTCHLIFAVSALEVRMDSQPLSSIPQQLQTDKYDVIIFGTDLIQSIVSSALSRAREKVLHCDGNEWYGGFDAVLYIDSTSTELETLIRCIRDNTISYHRGYVSL
jgi:RAB protein geranylgeranyltransferase component A